MSHFTMTQPQLGIIIFARMSSSRLPGKMLRPLGPTTLLERVVARARHVGYPLILATSTDALDDALVEATKRLGLDVFRGSLDNVLDRACEAALHAEFDGFARLCGDRPFFPIEAMQAGLSLMRQALRAQVPCDLITTALPHPVPPGFLTEIVNTQALCRVRERAKTSREFEHVTPAFYNDQMTYAVQAMPSALQNLQPLRMSVDTEHDRVVLGEVIRALPDIDVSSERAFAEMMRVSLDTQRP